MLYERLIISLKLQSHDHFSSTVFQSILACCERSNGSHITGMAVPGLSGECHCRDKGSYYLPAFQLSPNGINHIFFLLLFTFKRLLLFIIGFHGNQKMHGSSAVWGNWTIVPYHCFCCKWKEKSKGKNSSTSVLTYVTYTPNQ